MAKVLSPERFKLQKDLEEVKERHADLKTELSKLPHKRQLFIVAQLRYPEKTASELARMIGLSRQVADTALKPIGGKLKDAFSELGITQADIALALRGGLLATKQVPVVVPIYVDGKKSHSKIEIVEVVDQHLRVKTAMNLSKLGDYFPAVKVDVKKTSTVTHQLSDETHKQLELRDKMQRKVIEIEHETVN